MQSACGHATRQAKPDGATPCSTRSASKENILMFVWSLALLFVVVFIVRHTQNKQIVQTPK
jgi:hypothetical protein